MNYERRFNKMFNDDLSWLIILFAILLFIALCIEIYVVILMATFLASWFGFSGILWWVCVILLFGVINGLIGLVWRL